MRNFSFLIIILINGYLLKSCNFLKDCDKHIPDLIHLPLEVLNRNDTISLSDSIVIYTKFYTNGTDLKSGIDYDFKNLNMVAEMIATHITDSLPLSEFPNSNIDYYFDYTINIGSQYITSSFKPYINNDSMYYKITLYPKEIGFYRIVFYISNNYEFNERDGVVLNEDNKGCKLYANGFTFEPGKDLGIEDYNNFSMYYNSGLFNAGPVESSQPFEFHRSRNILSYFVYVVS